MFDRSLKICQSVSKNVNKLYFFPRKKLSPKLFSRTSRKQFWQSCRNTMARFAKTFCQKGETFSFNVRQDANKNKVTQKKLHLFSKCSSGRVESSFDKPVWKKNYKSPNFFQSVSEDVESYMIVSDKKRHSLKLFFRTSRRQFRQSCRRKTDKSRKCFAVSPEKFRSRSEQDKVTHLFCSKKTSFPQSVPIGTPKEFLTTILEKFATGTEMVAHCLEKGKKPWKFSKLHFFPQSVSMDM